ncbi:hypothetical protein KKE92_05125 [Candidatus Micrarchaeota archaeon]|nr:hypothetical protein [Candidatus Micrarchaeota archaeon]MBU1681845.1 hypothetical protein [Candidatus Micrarchaeota archaeon]
MSEIKSLADNARSIAKSGSSKDAWSKLKTWAGSQNHPSAMKVAVMQFLEAHGTSPDAVAVLPEVLRTASRIPFEGDERKTLIDMTDRAFKSIELNTASARQLPISDNRPAPILSLNPMKQGSSDIYAPVHHSKDVASLIEARNTLFHVNDHLLKKVKKDERSY